MSNAESSSSLGREFVAALIEALRRYAVTEPNIVLRIPAAAAEVGDLVVYDDNDELTVVVGKVDHRHFDQVIEAIEWVQAIIADRIHFRNEFVNGRLIAGSSWNPDRHDGGRLLEKTDEFREFTWTGVKIHEKRKP